MMQYITPLAILAVLILVNAVFVAAEFAVIASRRIRMEGLAETSATAKSVLKIVSDTRNQDRYIAVAQVGITLVTVALGMYAEPTIAAWLYGPLERWFGVSEAAAHTIATVGVLFAITYLHVVIGEMVPKAMALHAPEATAIGVHPVMRVLAFVFSPGVILLNAIAGAFLRMMKLPLHAGHHRLHSTNELEMLVKESTEGGVIEVDQRNLIEAIFDFGEREVYQCMTPRTRVYGLPVDATTDDVIELMAQSKHSRFPVYDGDLDHILGILHVKDFIRTQTERPGAVDLLGLLRRAPRVPLHMNSAKLLASFKRLRVHMAIVMDEYGGTEGIVTLEDLIEEVVGEVYDEHDQSSDPEISLDGDGNLLVEGEVLIEDFDELYPGALTSEDANTIGGLVLEELGRPAQVGDEVTSNGALLKVVQVDGLAVKQIQIILPTAPEETDEADE